MKKIWFLFAVLSIWSIYAQQKIEIKIIDQDKSTPIEGVEIVKNKYLLGKTDSQGLFLIDVKPDQFPLSLMIYAPGYKEKNIQIKQYRPQITVELEIQTFNLDEVVITSDPLRNPVHSVVVSDPEKKYAQPRNAADLFKDIPGVTLQKRSAMSIEPSLRSFKYEQMNIIYDGGFKVVNACPNRMDPATAHVIPEEVEKIEIIKGPFNVRFGQTFGAMVNLITRNTVDGKYGLKGRFQTGYETNGNNKVVLTGLTYAKKKFDITTNFSYRDFGDYIDGKNDTVPAGFQSTEYSVKIGINPSENQRFFVDWRQNFTRNVKHAGLPMDSPKDDSYLLGVDYKIYDLAGKIKSWHVKGYYSFVDHLMTNGYLLDQPRPNYPAMDAQTPVWSRTLGGKVELEHKPNDNMLIYWGANADVIARNGMKNVTVNVNPNTGVPLDPPMVKKIKVWQDSQINDFGVYSQLSWKKNKNEIITAGLRLDYVWAMAKDPAPGMEQIYGNLDAKTDLVFSTNISYRFKRGDKNFQVALGRGTRTPSMIERYIYRFVVFKDSRTYIGNPFLKPEVNNQFEISLVKNFESVQTGVDLYGSYFQNYITARLAPELATTPVSSETDPAVPRQFINADAYQYGADIFIKFKFTNEWFFEADYSYVKAWNLTFDEPLALVNPSGAYFKLKYNREKFWFDWRTEWRAAKKEFSVQFGETPTPSYWLHDFMAGYRPNNKFSIGISVSNVFDAAYYNHTTFVFRNAGPRTGQQIYEPGRNIGFMFAYKFDAE